MKRNRWDVVDMAPTSSTQPFQPKPQPQSTQQASLDASASLYSYYDYDALLGENDSAVKEDITESASVEVPIPSDNKGFEMMRKLGWNQGQGLGKHGRGRLEPVPHLLKFGTTGVGKDAQMDHAHAESTAKRKMMQSEVIAQESAEERLKREIKIIKSEIIKEEVKVATAAFYCELCDKQYNRISEYEVHLSSYDHNHRKRFKAMQELTKKGQLLGQADGTNPKKRSREDKEREREEKELKRLQEAAMAREQRSRGAVPPGAAAAKPSGQTTSQAPIPATISGVSAGFKPVTPTFQTSQNAQKPMSPPPASLPPQPPPPETEAPVATPPPPQPPATPPSQRAPVKFPFGQGFQRRR